MQRVRNSCFAQRMSAQTSGLHLVCVVSGAFFVLQGMYVVFPITEMFCMPSVELLGLIYQPFGFPHGRIPEVERILSGSG